MQDHQPRRPLFGQERQRKRDRQQHAEIARRAQEPGRADRNGVIRHRPKRVARPQLFCSRGEDRERGEDRGQIRQPQPHPRIPVRPERIAQLVGGSAEEQSQPLAPVLALINHKLERVSGNKIIDKAIHANTAIGLKI